MHIYDQSLHRKIQKVLDQHKPAKRNRGLLVAVVDGVGQTTCLCGHWTHGSYDDHVLSVLAHTLVPGQS